MLQYLVTIGCLLVSFVPEYRFHRLEDLAMLPVDHQLFGGPIHAKAHIDPAYYPSALTQGERVISIRETIKAAARAFREIGLAVFLESATLIGYLRDGDVIPWDVDGDMGYYLADCLAKFPAPGDLAHALRLVLKGTRFGISEGSFEQCEPQFGMDRVIGKIVDKTTGFFVDLFVYKDLMKLENWQERRSREWLMRANDEEQASLTFPKDTLFPLTEAKFFGQAVLLPANVREFLNYEYGSVLEAPLMPWKLMFYTRTSAASLMLTGLALVMSGDMLLGIVTAVVSSVARGGILVFFLLMTTVVSLKPGVSLHTCVTVLAVASLLSDLGTWLAQVRDVSADAINLYGLNLNPTRTQTICVPGTRICVDF
jgi:LicD family